MKERRKLKTSNILFLLFIVLLIIPQTRMPIQVGLHKILSKIKPISIEDSNREKISYETWTLLNGEGKRIDFSNLKDKVLVINFWATWCPPCVAEMASLNGLYNNFKSEEAIHFLFVSNEDDSVVKKFIKKNGYNFEVFQSLSEPPKLFEVSSIPRTFIINKNGDIVVDQSGAANWNSKKINDLIASLIKS